jgi:hypothetical protein
MVCKFVRTTGECALAVDGKVPSREQSRFGSGLYNGKRIAPAMKLGFIPDMENDFIVRGNSGTLLYEGKNISHRRTVLAAATLNTTLF